MKLSVPKDFPGETTGVGGISCSGDLQQELNRVSCLLLHWQAAFFTIVLPGKTIYINAYIYMYLYKFSEPCPY